MALDIINNGKDILSGISSAASTGVAGAVFAEHKINPNKEPQHAYRWEFLMRGIFGIKEEIQFYAKRAAVPAITHETIKKRYAGREYTFSGREGSTHEVTVQFWDNQQLQIYRFFAKWMNHMNNFHLNSKVNPINYQKSVILRLKDTTDGLITEEFSFLNCYPIELGEIELDYSSSSEASFDVTFVFDDMRIGYGVVDLVGHISDIIDGVSSISSSSVGDDLINNAASTAMSFL